MAKNYHILIENFKKKYGEDVYFMLSEGRLDPIKIDECFLPFTERFASGEIKSIYLVSRHLLEKYAGKNYMEKFSKNQHSLFNSIKKRTEELGIVAEDISNGLPVCVIVDRNQTFMPVVCHEEDKDLTVESDLDSKHFNEYMNKAFGSYRDDPFENFPQPNIENPV
ncbi:MAG: hypothetical protein QW286_02320, partial [Candidatus Aenigmatarchaeota archaeon]